MGINSLDRFLAAQEQTYKTALKEIKNGKKRSHWMWFIFPQLRVLGQSERAIFYGIKDVEETKEYLAHPILGARLIEISTALLAHKDKSPIAIMGDIDAVKLRSSMTLFACIGEENSVFHQVLQQFYKGKMCTKTLSRLNFK